MSQKIKDTAIEEVERVAAIAKEAGASQAYFYPIKVREFGLHILQRVFTLIGYLLLRCPSQSMATPYVKARSESDPWSRHYRVHVLSHLRASSRSNGVY